ncbi:hypothetical protein V8G57_19160 [Collimonas sp. H4R21]|uniref:Uncharacterized protein n=1 Tax=Collimonas rhizosphaerae TaxID=3126357 RepID=A0ABU9PZS4_9BURK
MNFLFRLFKKKPAPPVVPLGKRPESSIVPQLNVVEFNDEQVTRTTADGIRETLLWSELQEISIITTDGGPYVDDVFWELRGTSHGCLVPSEAEGIKELLSKLQELPGFNNEAVIQAMGSTDNARFLCWQREPGS